jgi:DNA (cytosine-5)-methyltransferase 1
MRITELCNAERKDNAAFYTNKFIVNEIMSCLPYFNKEAIRIIEPSVGAGGFLPFLIKKYEDIPEVIIDVIDIDSESIATLKLLLSKFQVPKNIKINVICQDFLTMDESIRYDLAVGNPPFSKLRNKTSEIMKYLSVNRNQNTNNLSEMFLEKCIRCSDCVALVLNKTVLSTDEFAETRELLRSIKIGAIIDFGRYGFTGVSIETMCLVVYPMQKPKMTFVHNLKHNLQYYQDQEYITDSKFPYFVIYRDKQFDDVANKLNFNVFNVFRDRQITKSITTPKPQTESIWVIKAKNIDDDSKGVSHIQGYDVYIPRQVAEGLSAYNFVNDDNVYLTPNMTYNPRVIENLPDVIPDGSVAVLIPKSPLRLTSRQREYFSSGEYRRFYSIARNLSTQSINVDKTSVYFYGVLKNEQ